MTQVKERLFSLFHCSFSSNMPQHKGTHINRRLNCENTSVPSLFWTGKTWLHSWMPVVSGSEPPLQEKPVSGSFSSPSQFSSLCRNTKSKSEGGRLGLLRANLCIKCSGLFKHLRHALSCTSNYPEEYGSMNFGLNC